MEKTTFKMSRGVLAVITTLALGGYIMAAVLNIADIQNAWQLIVAYFAIVIIYANVREKHVKKVAAEKAAE